MGGRSSPKNSSSIILSKTCDLISKENPDILGFITTHSPSFAASHSMISGGFEQILIRKECKKKFVLIKNGANEYWIHKVNRNYGFSDNFSVESLNEYALVPELILLRYSRFYKEKITIED